MKKTTESVKKLTKATVYRLSGNETVSVKFSRSVTHALYKKPFARTSSVLAHCSDASVAVGDIVSIIPIKPKSKRKHWQVVEVIEHVHTAPIIPTEEAI